jgi:hypothetical protein
MSRENAQDSEPSIAVNPANPQQIVGTAFTLDPLHALLDTDNTTVVPISIDPFFFRVTPE